MFWHSPDGSHNSGFQWTHYDPVVSHKSIRRSERPLFGRQRAISAETSSTVWGGGNTIGEIAKSFYRFPMLIVEHVSCFSTSKWRLIYRNRMLVLIILVVSVECWFIRYMHVLFDMGRLGCFLYYCGQRKCSNIRVSDTEDVSYGFLQLLGPFNWGIELMKVYCSEWRSIFWSISKIFIIIIENGQIWRLKFQGRGQISRYWK